MNVEWLASTAGQALIRAAADSGTGPGDIERLRRSHPDIPIEDIGAAVHQSWLRQRAALRWGRATDFLMTTDGLEQATRPEVAAWHAQQLTQVVGGPAHVVDLTCGLGFDAAAFARAGHTVVAVERDPEVAALARHNLATLDVAVLVGDAADVAIPPDTDVVYVDPARRDPSAARDITGRAHRVQNPARWSPPWPVVEHIAQRHRVLAKVAPGLDDTRLPGWDVDFVSADADLVEAFAVSGGQGRRRAVLLRRDQPELVVAGGSPTPARDLGGYLLLPDPALVRAHALTWLAQRVSGGLVHPRIAWLASDDDAACRDLAADPHHPAAVLTVLEAVPYRTKDLRRAVAAHPHRSLTVMTRGLTLDVDRERKALIGTVTLGAPELVVAVFRGERGATAVLGTRLATSPGRRG